MIFLQQAQKIYLSDEKRFVGKQVKTIGEFETVGEVAAVIRELKLLLPNSVFYVSSKPCNNWRKQNG